MNLQIPTHLNTFTFATYVEYYLWSMVSTNHLD